MNRPPLLARRRLKRLLLALAVLVVFYLVAANVFLNTPMASWAVNRRPQRFRVSWSSAWSVWPGAVWVRGLQLRGWTSNDVSWTVAVQRGRGWVALPALLGRRFVISEFRGEGVRSSVLRGPGKGAPPEKPKQPDEKPRPPWGIRISGIDLTDVREVGYNEFRLTGEGGHIEGSFAVVFGREFRFDGGRLVMPRARLWMGREILAEDLDVDGKLSFAPYAPRQHPGLEGWDFFTGSLAAHGRVPPSLPFLAKSGLPGTGKSGRLFADLRAEKGRLVTGSRAELIAGTTAGSGPAFTLTAEVGGGSPGLLLGLQAQGLQAGRLPGRAPIFQCAAVSATVQSPVVQLRRLFVTAREVRTASNLSASPPLAGDVRIENVRLDAPGPRATMRLTVDRAVGRFDVVGLLRQELDVEGLQAQGISAQLDLAPPQKVNPKSAGEPWSVRVHNTRLTGIRDLGINELRLAGPSSAEASFNYDPDGNLSVERASFNLPNGALLVNGQPAAQRLAVKAEARVDPLVLGSTPALTFLRQVSGSAEVRAAISSFGFLDPFLSKVALKIQGEGNLDAAVQLDAGRVRAGSRLAVRQARVSAAFLDTLASGSGLVTFAVDPQSRPALRVHLDRFGFADLRQPGHPIYVRGRGLEMSANAAGALDLAGAVPDFDASLAMTNAEVPDLQVYNALLPEGAGFSILSGAGRAGLRLALSTVTGKTRGTAFLTSNEARVQVQNLGLQGRVALQVPFSSPDLQSRHFDLDGVQVTLDRVAYGEGGEQDEAQSRPPDWWARARIADGSVVWGQPLSLKTTGEVAMKDSGPLIALFAQRNRLVKWFDDVLSVEGVTARGVLRIENGVVAIESLQAKGGNLELHSRMRFSKTSKTGDLLVRYGRLKAGVELLDGKRDFKLIHAQEWFDSRAGGQP